MTRLTDGAFGGSLSATHFTFDALNWNTPQTLTIQLPALAQNISVSIALQGTNAYQYMLSSSQWLVGVIGSFAIGGLPPFVLAGQQMGYVDASLVDSLLLTLTSVHVFQQLVQPLRLLLSTVVILFASNRAFLWLSVDSPSLHPIKPVLLSVSESLLSQVQIWDYVRLLLY